jgi:hypothetical protein
VRELAILVDDEGGAEHLSFLVRRQHFVRDSRRRLLGQLRLLRVQRTRDVVVEVVVDRVQMAGVVEVDDDVARIDG